METSDLMDIRPEVATAVRECHPVVALESTLIAHGLPWPLNLETARAAEAAVRKQGALPATIAVLRGRLTVGLTDAELEMLAQAKDVLKASRRDLAVAVAQGRTAATTVAAARADTPEQVADLVLAHWRLEGAGVVVAQPVAPEVAVEATELEQALARAESEAANANVRGKELTPFLLARLAALTEGRTLRAN